MSIDWRNGFFVIGREMLRGPYARSIFLAWNDRELITGHEPPLGEYRHADHMQITWEWPWPRFRGFQFRRFKMHWKDCQP